MKKLFVVLSVLTISLFGVLGCTKSETPAPSGGDTTETTEQAPAEGGE